MSQINIDYRSDGFDPKKEFGPPGREETYISIQDTSTKRLRLLAYLKDEKSFPATDRELYPILYSDAFRQLQNMESTFISLGADGVFDVRKSIEIKYIKEVKKVISRINNSAFSQSKEFNSEQEQLEYLWDSELILVVGETENGEAIRDYHGPSRRQPLEVLSQYIEWATDHAEMQSQPRELGIRLRQAAQYGPIFNAIDTEFDTPDEQMDAFLDNEQGNLG